MPDTAPPPASVRIFDPEPTTAALRESEERLRSVFHAVPSGIVFKGPSGEIIDCNAAAEKILGVERDPVTGALTADPRIGAIHEDGSPYPFQDWPVMVALRTGRPVMNSVMGIRRGTREVRWLRLNAVPLSRPGASPHAAVVSLEDISEERRASMEAARAGAQLRHALECAGHAYWEVDIPTRRFTAGAPWMLLGYGEHDLDGSTLAWLELAHPDDRAGVAAAWLAHTRDQSPWFHVETRARAKDGSWRWILARGRATRDDAGHAIAMAGTLTEITETKRIQEQFRQAEHLTSLGTLAAGIAHEVNNPLACVAANLAYLQEELRRIESASPGAGAFADQRRAVADALEGASRMTATIANLRQFSAPPSSAERAPIDPGVPIAGAVALVRHEIAHRARLEVEIPAGLPPVVAREHEISQLAVNLLLNAMQAIPEGRASEHVVTVRVRPERDRVALSVTDTGTGIPPADLPRIFDPFFTTRRPGAGSGLGLTLCHGIASSLGGTIEVDSVVGRGSTFRVLLPVRPPPAASPPAPERGPSARSATVLVIDDEPLVGRSLARLLGAAHDVVVVTSAREALQRVRAGERWDAILCDVMMPQMSGIEFHAALAKEQPDLLDRVLYMTGGAFTESSRAFLAAGHPYLSKPIAPDELRQAVARIVAAGAPPRSP